MGCHRAPHFNAVLWSFGRLGIWGHCMGNICPRTNTLQRHDFQSRVHTVLAGWESTCETWTRFWGNVSASKVLTLTNAAHTKFSNVPWTLDTKFCWNVGMGRGASARVSPSSKINFMTFWRGKVKWGKFYGFFHTFFEMKEYTFNCCEFRVDENPRRTIGGESASASQQYAVAFWRKKILPDVRLVEHCMK